MRKRIKGALKKVSIFHDKHENIIMFLILFIIVLSYSFHYKLIPYDYLWNFGNIYKLFLGYTIYKDVAIIITPLMFYIGEALFKAFGANFFIYNLFNVVIEMIYYICFFVILKKLTKSIKLRDFCLVSLVLCIGKTLGDNGPNYIPFSAIFIMLIIILMLYFNNKKWVRVLNGIFAGLAFLTYQKAGAVAALVIILYELLNTENPKFRDKICNLSISTICAILVAGTYIGYLAFTDNLYNFLDIAILGIGEFSNNFSMWPGTMVKLVIFTLLTISFFVILKVFEKIDNKIILLFIASICSVLYLLPIINEYHSYIWVTFDVLFLIYSINVIFDGIDLISVKQNIVVLSLMGLLVGYILIEGLFNMNKYPFYKTNYKDMFFGSTLSEEQSYEIDEINAYVETKKDSYISYRGYPCVPVLPISYQWLWQYLYMLLFSSFCYPLMKFVESMYIE